MRLGQRSLRLILDDVVLIDEVTVAPAAPEEQVGHRLLSGDVPFLQEANEGHDSGAGSYHDHRGVGMGREVEERVLDKYSICCSTQIT